MIFYKSGGLFIQWNLVQLIFFLAIAAVNATDELGDDTILS